MKKIPVTIDFDNRHWAGNATVESTTIGTHIQIWLPGKLPFTDEIVELSFVRQLKEAVPENRYVPRRLM